MSFSKSVTLITAVLVLGISSGRTSSLRAEESARERILEQRLEHLEAQVKRLEALLRAKGAQPSSSLPNSTEEAPHRAATSRAGRGRGRLHATQGAQVGSSGPAEPPPAAPRQAVAQSPSVEVGQTPNHAPDPPNAGPTREAPQELHVLRENTVTLGPKSLELSTDFQYASRRTDLQKDAAFISNTSIRYGLLPWLELSLTIPVGYTKRTTVVSPGGGVTSAVSGLGDLLLQGNARVMEQTENWPGIVFSLGAFLPTGRSPYEFSGYALDVPGFAPTPNPTNIFADNFSRGAWGIRSNLQFYKTVDPLILFFGFGVDRFFPQRIGNFVVDTGYALHYNLGFSFALSEKTTLGFTVDGQHLSAIRVNSRNVFDSATQPTLARLSLIQRIAKQTYIEPALSFGLNRDAPDFAIDLGLRRRF